MKRSDRQFDRFPGGKRFAFTVIDDTDDATVENVQPVYRLLEDLGLKATKTVWPVSCPEGSKNFFKAQTLDDKSYLDFVLDLQRRGFEIGYHGATMETSKRERTVRALERFRVMFGSYPRVYANHGYNRENLYWGADRIDSPLLRLLYRRVSGSISDRYSGHLKDSDYWWGDIASRHIVYVRNLTFRQSNLARVNPSMPYHDPSRPLVQWWFSATDAADAESFNQLLTPARLERLQEEGGFCVVATHFGKRFAQDGSVDGTTRKRLEYLSRLDGWFPTVGELLDWLRARRATNDLPSGEWRTMQWRWAAELFMHQVQRRCARMARTAGM